MKRPIHISIIRIYLIVAIVLSPLCIALGQSTVTSNNQITEFDVNGMKVLIKRRPGTPTVAAAGSSSSRAGSAGPWARARSCSSITGSGRS